MWVDTVYATAPPTGHAVPLPTGRAAAPLTGEAPDGKGDRLAEACRELEAEFVAMLLREMRRTVPEPTLMGASFGTRMSQEMLDEELARSLSKGRAGGLGIAEMLYRELAGLGGAHHGAAELPGVRATVRWSGSVEVPEVHRGGGERLPLGRGAPRR